MTATTPVLFTELPPTPPSPAGLRRRWFTAEQMDLIVWIRGEAGIEAFQLCYDKPLAEQALSWQLDRGFTHQAVDAGDAEGLGHKGAPLLTPGNAPDPARLLHELGSAGPGLPASIRGFVEARLQHYPAAS